VASVAIGQRGAGYPKKRNWEASSFGGGQWGLLHDPTRRLTRKMNWTVSIETVNWGEEKLRGFANC